MRKSRFTTEQIIGFIKQAEAGMAGDRWRADSNVSAVNFERNRKSEAWCVGKDRLIASVPFNSRAVMRLEVQLGLFDAVDRVDWEFMPRRKRRIQGKSLGPDVRQLALEDRR